MNTNLDIVTLGSNPEALASREPFVVNQAHSGSLDPRVLDNRKKKTDWKQLVFLCFCETHIYKKKTKKENF